MNEYDVRRLGLLLAIQAEIEGMKIANAERNLPMQVAAYDEKDFQAKAEELRNASYCPDQQL